MGGDAQGQTAVRGLRHSTPPAPAPNIAGPTGHSCRGAKPISGQLQPNRPTVPVHSADGRPVGRRHIVDGLTPVAIDQSGTIRCTITGHTLWIAPGSPTERANPEAAEQINKHYQPAKYLVIA
ncbi:hypothetical protein [Aeromonas enteropelogenes]|uniref:hypothetical protein n=1 Tax=Aeromonas enteropelogenes TaxID=29489 RepID=UPI003BA312A9